MASFLERYVAGEHEQVWDELVLLGQEVRKPPLLADAQAVARETMRRAKENIGRLIPRLGDIGFRFAYEPDPSRRDAFWWGDSHPVYEPPGTGTERLLNDAEQRMGPIPLSLRAWWEVVGSVNFIGTHPGWPEIEEIDPLVVGSVEMLEEVEEDYSEWLEETDEEERADCLFPVPVAPDSFHKANLSGGGPYGVEFPCEKADGLFADGPLTFVQYLRAAFKWGGFPGFESVEPARRPSEQLVHLTRGLLPI